MTAYDWSFALCVAGLFVTEFFALARDHDQTLTHKVVRWIKLRRTMRRRLMIGVFIAWLFWHFAFQFFR